MNFINYISNLAMPLIILLVVFYGLKEKIKVFDVFLIGAKDGINMVVKIFPTLIGLFVAIGALRSSGILDLIIKIISPVLNVLHVPSEVMPLALLRPISGRASMAVATDIMKTYGVDSFIGIVSGVIMGSTETTLYTIAVYTGCVKIKNIRFVLVSALIADLFGILASVYICNFLLN